MAKHLSKKSVSLGLTGLAVVGFTCAVVMAKKSEQAETNRYLDEYQEEAYPIKSRRTVNKKRVILNQVSNASLSGLDVLLHFLKVRNHEH